MEDLKKCPDCAEMVRAEARVCRFCGYRFDGARAGGGHTFLDLLRRPRTDIPLPDLLAGWGSQLRDGETVGYFGYCKLESRVESSYGFLLITSERLAFFAGGGAKRVLEWPLAEVGDVEPCGRRGGRGLQLAGPDGTVTLRHFDSRRALADIARQLGSTLET
jgi:Uncharacterised protein family UPF0547